MKTILLNSFFATLKAQSSYWGTLIVYLGVLLLLIQAALRTISIVRSKEDVWIRDLRIRKVFIKTMYLMTQLGLGLLVFRWDEVARLTTTITPDDLNVVKGMLMVVFVWVYVDCIKNKRLQQLSLD